MALPPNVTTMSADIRSFMLAMTSLTDLADPTAKPVIEANRGDLKDKLEMLVDAMPTADRPRIETFIDLQVASTEAMPAADRLWLTDVVIEAIRAKLPAGTPDPEAFKEYDLGVPEVDNAMTGAGLDSEQYRNSLIAFWSPAKLAFLAAARAGAGGGGGHTPLAATPTPGVTDPHAAAAHHPQPPIEEDEVVPVLVIGEGRARTVRSIVTVLVSLGITTWLASTFVVLYGSAEGLAGDDAPTIATLLVVVGWVMIFAARLFATMLDKAEGAEFAEMRQGEPWYFFRTSNLVSLIATGLTFLLLVGVAIPTYLGGGSIFLSTLYIVVILAVTMWGELTRRHYQARWVAIRDEKDLSARQRKLHDADRQYRSGRTIFWVTIVLALLAHFSVGYGKAGKHFLDERTADAKVEAAAAATMAAETQAKVEAAAAASLKSSCQKRIAALEDATKEGETYIDFCLATDSQVIKAECIAVGEECS